MMRIVTANLNGIRSAAAKGFFDWIGQQQADAVGVQEIKAQPGQISGAYDRIGDMPGHFHCAQKPGYSGVGLYLREEPSDVITGLGDAGFDAEGRWVEARYDRPGRRLSLVSCYFPSGSSGEERQQAKFRFLDLMYPKLMALRAEREFILVGDVNIAHQAIDLKNWRSNQKNSGFLPEERAWMTQLLTEGGLVDVYRHLHPDTTDTCYTWWSNRGQAYANNVGWRLDYQIATPALAAQARRAAIYKDQKFSDHAPLCIDYELAL
ncbi:exodeoxyribonuclease III [Comamonas granuli]|uniref:exodeoxyribonuclease III n=1 Tax=Comamonas granuli TaxID=290309 RepID=UPI0005AA369A|nr:exodeoxyribonuclease III [Comamonas granuli]